MFLKIYTLTWHNWTCMTLKNQITFTHQLEKSLKNLNYLATFRNDSVANGVMNTKYHID